MHVYTLRNENFSSRRNDGMGYIYAVGYTMPSFETTIRKPLSSKSSHRLTSAPMETHPLSREYVNGEEEERREGKGSKTCTFAPRPSPLGWR